MYAISAVDIHNEYASAVFGPYEDENEAVAALPKAAETLAKQIVELEIDEQMQLRGLVEIKPPQSVCDAVSIL